jgi:hypothetical protein
MTILSVPSSGNGPATNQGNAGLGLRCDVVRLYVYAHWHNQCAVILSQPNLNCQIPDQSQRRPPCVALQLKELFIHLSDLADTFGLLALGSL